jgi:hypothetical protein
VKELTEESGSSYIFPLSTNGERPVCTDSLARSIMYFRAFNPELKFSRHEIYVALVKR